MITFPGYKIMNSLDSEPLFGGFGSGGDNGLMMMDCMMGGADPLLSQAPDSVLNTYNSSADEEVSNDFSEEQLMPSSSLYSLYLMHPNSDSRTSPKQKLDSNHCGSNDNDHKFTSNGRTSDSEENIDVLSLDNHSQSTTNTNGLDHDALFEGMPFYELKGREVGPCTYCNMWRAIRFLSYCGIYPFCSVSCTKKFAVYKREKGELLEKTSGDLNTSQHLNKVPTLFEEHKPQPLFPPRFNNPKHSRLVGVNSSIPNGSQLTNGHNSSSSQVFDWSEYLQDHDTEAAPVKCFCHAPLSQEWKGNLTGAMIEVHNRDVDESPNSFWVARVIQMAGYKARLRFEGYGMDSSHDFSLHLLMAECYPVNGAVKMGHVMKPPKGVLARLGNNWQEHLARVAHSGSPTIVLPKNKDYLECKFKAGMHLEAVYKRQISNTIVATVTETVANRIHVQYDGCKDPSKDFWFHETSPWIHPTGWSQRVGHPIISTAAYKSEALDKGRNKKTGPEDAPWEIFNMPTSNEDSQFRIGMKLEVVDPLRLGTVCVATVMEILRDGYLMIGVDGCLEDTNSWFCCHYTSPALLPVGFCEYHKIDLQPPRGHENNFDWVDYLRQTESVSAPIEIFHQKTVDRGFKVGHKLEAVDLIESGFICVATVTKVAGPLLRVHFDGWDRSFDQWMDCDSPDICPVGWCEMVSYPLQPPRIHESQDYISITPVCKPISRRKHYPTGEKRRMSLTPALERMSRDNGDEAQKIYSFSDEESNHDRSIIPPPPKKQLVKKPPQNRSNLKLKMPKSTSKHNGKGRPHEPASHHNYALPSSRQGSMNQPGQQVHERVAMPETSVQSEQTFSMMTSDYVNGFMKQEKMMEKGEFIVEVEKGVVESHSRPDASISSLDSPPLSADSSSGSNGGGASSHQSGSSDSKGDPEGPGKFTMRNWSHVEHKQCTKMLSSRPFKDFGKERNDEFGIETYDFEDASMTPSVLIPSVNKHEKKKKKKKKKKNKKKKDKEKDKDEEKDKEKDKEHKHKKEGKKKKSKIDKERKKERRKEKAKAKAKASQLATLLNLPTELPSVMQTDQTSGEENVLNHILNDKNTPPGGLDLNRMSKVKFSMNTGSNPDECCDVEEKDNRTASDKVSALDKLLVKSSSDSVAVRVAPYTVCSQTLKSDSAVFTSEPDAKPLESKATSNVVSKEPKISAGFTSSFVAQDVGKTNVQRTDSFIEKSKSKNLTLKERLAKEPPSAIDDPYNFEAEPSEVIPVRTTKEKTSKTAASTLRKETTKIKTSQDTAALFESQVQVQKIIKDVNTSLASQELSKPRTASKETGQAGKKGKKATAPTAPSRAKMSEEDELKLRQLRSLFLQQEKISDILTKQQQAKRNRIASNEEQSGLGMINTQGIAGAQIGFLNSMGGSTAPSLPSPQQQQGMIRMMMHEQAQRSRPPPSSLPLGPELASPSNLSPSSHPGVFPGFRPTRRDLCNMVALSRPPKEFCMPANVRSPSPTAMLQGLTHPPRMSPTSIPLSSPTSMSPTISRPPPTYGAHLSQALRNIPRSPVDPRSDFLPFPPKHPMPIDSNFPMPHPHTSTPQRLPPLQSLLMQPRYPPLPHPKKSPLPAQTNHSLGSPQPSGVPPPPTHILALPPPSVPPPPYNLHQAMVNQQSPLPSPLGRPSSSASSPQTSPATPVEPMTERPTTPCPPVEKMSNPWTWGIAEVVQFLAETGEGSCAECFCRQNINGQKLMSLTKEQLVKLTGMKVAPSLKIYEQIVKLRARFPMGPLGPSPQTDSMAR